jgi:outer membrane protein assembly factor BamB/predicted phosphohydrolase
MDFMNCKKSFFRSIILPGLLSLIIVFSLVSIDLHAQPFSFAHVTDTHIGGGTGADDLIKTVADINTIPGLDFVLVTGDISEFGSGEELRTAKKILDALKIPYYLVPGNHDSKWSESGCNDFVKIFGSETFAFEHKGIFFIGTASGPNMRMGPGLVPREELLWLDSLLMQMKNPSEPLFFINHYPLDESLANSAKVKKLLRIRNIQVVLLGHGHANRQMNFDGIPGIMGRSNLRASAQTGGYNIATIKNDTLYYEERIPGKKTLAPWCRLPLLTKVKVEVEDKVEKVKAGNGEVKEIWSVIENSDIGGGIASSGGICVYAGTDGMITARNRTNHSLLWQRKTGGKVYSTPAVRGRRVICPSTDGTIYCLDKKTGGLLWSFKTGKPIVGSPSIKGNRVFIGSSESVFRALNLSNGKLVWQFDSVRNFVETKPLLYKKGVYFGSWGNTFYALDQKTGKLLWKREKYTNRMLSPAAVWPVAGCGKVFIVAPDRHLTALDAKTGREIRDSGKYSCRESIGISGNGKQVYIKNMTEGNVDAFYTCSDSLQLAWECKARLGYEIAPSPITENRRLIFIPTATGKILAIGKKSHLIEWEAKVSEVLVNHILPVRNHMILVTTFDGKIVCLKY